MPSRNPAKMTTKQLDAYMNTPRKRSFQVTDNTADIIQYHAKRSGQQQWAVLGEAMALYDRFKNMYTPVPEVKKPRPHGSQGEPQKRRGLKRQK